MISGQRLGPVPLTDRLIDFVVQEGVVHRQIETHPWPRWEFDLLIRATCQWECRFVRTWIICGSNCAATQAQAVHGLHTSAESFSAVSATAAIFMSGLCIIMAQILPLSWPLLAFWPACAISQMSCLCRLCILRISVNKVRCNIMKVCVISIDVCGLELCFCSPLHTLVTVGFIKYLP